MDRASLKTAKFQTNDDERAVKVRISLEKYKGDEAGQVSVKVA